MKHILALFGLLILFFNGIVVASLGLMELFEPVKPILIHEGRGWEWTASLMVICGVALAFITLFKIVKYPTEWNVQKEKEQEEDLIF